MNEVPFVFRRKFKRVGKDGELMIKILNSTTEVLKEKNQPENALTYFLALLSLLGDKQTNSMNGNILKLINMIYSEIPANVLVSKFDFFSNIFINLDEKFKNSENVVLPLIQSMTNLLKEQPNNSWLENEDLLKIFKILMGKVLDSRESISNKAKKSISFILSLKKPASLQMVGNFIQNFAQQLFDKTSSKKFNPTLSFLELLDECFIHLLPNNIVGLSNLLVKLTTLQQNNLNNEILKIFLNYFSNDSISIPPESVVQILENFISIKLNIQEEYISNNFSKLIYTGYMKVFNHDQSISKILLLPIFEKLITLLESKKKGVSIHGYQTIIKLIQNAITDEMINEIYSKNQKNCLLMKIITKLHQCLSLKYSTNLDFIFQIFGNLFKRFGKKSYPILSDVLISMEKLHDSKHGRIQLESSIGMIIAAMGPIEVLTILPLNLLDEKLSRKWMLPLLRQNGTNSELFYFIKNLIPLGKQLLQQSTQVNSFAEKQLKTLYENIWFLFPAFSIYATDFPKAFPSIVDDLLEPLQEESDIRNTICTTFHSIITKNKEIIDSSKIPSNINTSVELAKETLDVLSKNSEVFFPILFNLYDDCNKTDRIFISRAISSFSSITSTKIVNDYFKSILKKLLTITNEIEEEDLSYDEKEEKINKKYILADLAIAMSENLPNQSVDIFFKVIKPQLFEEDTTTQKKAYRSLLEIIKKKSMDVTLIYEILKESLSVCKPSSKKYRLKCFQELLTNYDIIELFIPQLIGESIMGTKELNSETRENSMKLLITLISKFSFGSVSFDLSTITDQQKTRLCLFMKQLLSGLGGTSEIMISGTIDCLSNLMKEYGENIESVIPDILKNVLILLQYENRQVIRSVLNFIKNSIIELDANYISSFVPNLVKSLTSIEDKNGSEIQPLIKNIFTRLIKMFTYEKIIEILPEDDPNKQFLKNIKRDLKKKKSKSKDENSSNKELYLQEDDENIDLLDSGMMKNITKQPKEEKEEEKMEEEDNSIVFNEKKGKFVIKDEEEEEKKKNKKRKRGNQDFDEINQVEDERLMDDFNEDIEEDDDDKVDVESFHRQKKQKVERKRGYGEDYKPRKGTGGDVKRKNKPDPFAYIPLDPNQLNKRKGKNQSTFKEFENYSKAAKKGAISGRRKKRY
eukprot:gene6377-10384_t